jgi:hypothetical protein
MGFKTQRNRKSPYKRNSAAEGLENRACKSLKESNKKVTFIRSAQID